MPELFWFVDGRGAPMVFDAGAGGRNMFVFPFFTSRADAQRHRDQSVMGGEWRLTSSRSADEIIGLCERQSEQSADYDAFAFDPQAMPGEELHPATLEETKKIVDDHVGADAWDPRRYHRR